MYFGCQEFDFAECLLQHPDDMDLAQDTLTAVGESQALNPVLNGVLAGFNRRRRFQRFKFAHHTLELDRLRYATTTGPLDSDLLASELTKLTKDRVKSVQPDSTKRWSRLEVCFYLQR